jgi:hypothetical protein
VLRGQRLDPLGEGVPATVARGVDEVDGPAAGGGGLQHAHRRGDAHAAGHQHQRALGRGLGVQHEVAAGGQGVERVAHLGWSCSQLETLPPSSRLTLMRSQGRPGASDSE